MSIRKEGRKMALVKAQMSFYHDSVGSKAKDETFEVKSEQTVTELEQAGYVQRESGQALKNFEQTKSLEQKVGQRNALANEAVSLAGHEHNQQAAQHQQQFAQMRQQAGQAAVEKEITRLEQSGETQRAEQLRSALESQKQQMNQQQSQQPQQTQQQSEESRNARMEAEKAAVTSDQMQQNNRIKKADK
jgi:hypothetical protein